MLQTTEKPVSFDDGYQDRALSAEQVRSLCYQAAAEARMAYLALQSVEKFDMDETLLAINLHLHRWENVLNDVAGGATFDRLERLEETAEKRS